MLIIARGVVDSHATGSEEMFVEVTDSHTTAFVICSVNSATTRLSSLSTQGGVLAKILSQGGRKHVMERLMFDKFVTVVGERTRVCVTFKPGKPPQVIGSIAEQ